MGEPLWRGPTQPFAGDLLPGGSRGWSVLGPTDINAPPGTEVEVWPADSRPQPTDGYAAYICQECGSDVPWWRIERVGDVIVSWACFSHLPDVCLLMQRTDGQRTELVVMER